MSFDTLYKRTVTGAVQQWRVEVEGDRYRTISGQVGGQQVTSEWTLCKPKNVGRINATTAHAQALAQAEAVWKKKQRDGYTTSFETAEESTRFSCMLAQLYRDEKRFKEAQQAAQAGRLYSQPKLDGVRCIATRHGLMSRKDRPIISAGHVQEALQPLFKTLPDLVIDGELYNHELKDDFNAIVSLVRKSKPTQEDLLIAADTVQYHVYDCFIPSEPQLVFTERHQSVVSMLAGVHSSVLQRVETTLVDTAQVDSEYDRYLAAGYEGQMLRIDGPYEQRRSPLLLKRKEHDDAEFLVLSIEEGVGNRSGQAGFVVVHDRKHNQQFKASITGDYKQRVELLENSAAYVDGEVTVRFNGRTPDGVPRFPRAVAWYPGGRNV